MKETLPSLQAVWAADDSKYSFATQSLWFSSSATERQSNNIVLDGVCLSAVTLQTPTEVYEEHNKSHT